MTVDAPLRSAALALALVLAPIFAGAQPSATAPSDVRAALMDAWSGEYDLTEEILVAGDDRDTRIGASPAERIQYVVRPAQVPWLGTHVLYAEEFPYDEPTRVRRQVLLVLEVASPLEGDVRVRQFTLKSGPQHDPPRSRDDVESLEGCDLWLIRSGNQFRGGTRGAGCTVARGVTARYVDYQMVVGESLFWYRRRIVESETDELLEEVAGYRHFDIAEARLFSCRVRWSPDGTRRAQREVDSLDVHDQGGRTRFKLPDGRQLEIELHGRDWPSESRRQSLVLILNAVPVTAEPLASSWTALDSATIGVDLGWVAIDCGPVVDETDDTVS